MEHGKADDGLCDSDSLAPENAPKAEGLAAMSEANRERGWG